MILVRGFLAQLNVVQALILRETRTRFGAHQLGYLWAIFEAAIIIVTFYVLFKMANRTAPDGMELISFLTTGMLPYQLFSSSVNRVSQSIDGNKALLFYPQVNPLDLAIARTVLEAATYALVFIIIIACVALWEQQVPAVDEVVFVIMGFLLAALLGAVLGQVFCAISVLSKLGDRLRGPLLRPLFWTSGLFYTANSLPSEAREVLLYNPVLHVVEIVRAGWFLSYEAVHARVGYVAIWILLLGLLGLLLERVVRRRIEVT
ncbi:MAG: ABC transporter permease [Haliangiales bacterium]